VAVDGCSSVQKELAMACGTGLSSTSCIRTFLVVLLVFVCCLMSVAVAGKLNLNSLLGKICPAVLPTTDRLQLGWLTSGVDPGGGEVLTPRKYVGKVRLYFEPS